jgi:hypothetical protein
MEEEKNQKSLLKEKKKKRRVQNAMAKQKLVDPFWNLEWRTWPRAQFYERYSYFLLPM